jgi:hypothetical protein
MISGMYFYYQALAKLFWENLVSKAGDETSCRHYHINLLSHCHPQRLKKINGCAFIYNELERSIEKRMTPNYAQYIQRLINTVVAPECRVGQRVAMESFSLSRRGTWPELPAMRGTTGESSQHMPSASPPSARRGAPPRRPKRGAARFFKGLWDMCRCSYDVAHKSLELSQENHRRHNEFLASKNLPIPPSGTSLDPVPYVEHVMPPIEDEMFHGFDFSQLSGFASSSSRPFGGSRRARGDDDSADDDADESEDEEAEEDPGFGG